MSQDPLSFFTIDRGTATTAAALIAPCEDRFRLLAASSVPAGADVEALIEDLAWRVERTDPGILGHADRWREWARLEVRSIGVPRVCVVAGSPATRLAMSAAFSGAGWLVAEVPDGAPLDVLAVGARCLDPSVTAVALGVPDGATGDERAVIPGAWDLLMSLASMRDDLIVITCGPVGEQAQGLPESRIALLPPPEPGGLLAPTPLREAARQLAASLGPSAVRRRADSRDGLRVSIASLAALLDRRVDGVDVGVTSGSRTLAAPGVEDLHLAWADGALVPEGVLDDDAQAEAILLWSTLRGDPLALADRVRNLRLTPWREVTGDGGRLRLAALRAALSRLAAAWSAGAAELGGDPGADIVVASGGAFSALPPPAAALALVDTLRRPGAVTLLHDHARVLAPIGTLPDEGDRRRLLADLLDDILLPLGSALLTGEVRGSARGPSRLRVSSTLGEQEVPLLPDAIRLVDLPPGIVARLDIEAREGEIMGVRSQYLTLEVSGGLAGLLVDSREIPIRLPDTPERRREAIESWEHIAWAGADA